MKQKLLNSIKLRALMLVAVLCALFTGTAWGAEDDTHDFSQSLSQLLNNNASIAGINIEAQTYPVKKVIISYRYNKTLTNAVTMSVSVGGNDWGSQYSEGTGSNYSTVEFSGDAVEGAIDISFTNNTGSGTGHGTFYVNNIQLVEGAAGGGDDPSISANNVNIAYTATNGSIAYSLANATGNVTASVTSGDWLSLGEITASAVPFTCSANEGTERTAQVTLSFTGATDKVVTVTQAAAPLANIAALTANTETDTYYVTLSDAVVTYVNGNYAYIQDASGAVVVYKSGHGLNAGDVLNGTATVSYQLRNNNPQITDISGVTPTSGSAPTPAAIAQSSWAYTFNDVLSQYFKITGATITQSNGKYYVSLNGDNVQLYKAGGSISSLDLEKTYNITGFPTLYNSTKELQIYSDPEEVTNPTLAATPATAQTFTYVVGNGPSDDQMFTITGANLVSADITAAVSSDYEITDDAIYDSSVTIASDDIVSVRLKAGLSKGTHNGTLTLSSTDATDLVINLSGSVTGTTYTISVDDDVTGGTIEADLASAEEGATVTLTATPNAAYTFGSWTVYEDDMETTVTVTDNQFTMPACEVYVTATFNAKPTYAIICAADPVAGGELEASPASAYEGQTVTLSYLAESGYDLSSIAITKTEDGSATGITPAKSGDDYTFTMPGYAVTATATFLSNTFEGTFAMHSGALTEGDYILVYNGKALKNSVSSSKFGIQSVTPSNNTITDPLRSIVWHIAPSATDGYWTIYNAQADSYANGSQSNTNVSLGDDPTANTAIWAVSGTYDFRCKANEGQSTARYLRYYENSEVFGNYASSNGGALTLYKYTVLTPRTITFNGNGGTYNEASTYTQDVYDGVEATLDANKFTQAGYEFVAWNNQADGEGANTYNDEAAITVSGGDLTLYAQWAPLYTLTIDDAIVGGSVAVEGAHTSSVEGAEITLTYSPSAGYGFSAWDVYKEGDTSTKVTVTDNKFTMPAYNVVISATFEAVQTYSLVTDIAQLVPGKHYIIASGTNGSVKAMAAQNTNNRTSVSVTASSGIIPETDGVYEFVIYGPDANDYYTIYDETNEKYLYAANSSKNYLKTQDANDANGKWTIAIANTGIATVKAQGSYTHNWMRNNGDIFSCYASGQDDIYLYVKDGDTPVATTASVTLNAYGYATYASTSALDFLDAENADYSAWQITGVADSKITFGQISGHVAEGTGILLKGTPSATINLNILPAGGETLGDNKLEGIKTATAVADDTYYGLSGDTFKKVNAGTVPAGKALLPAAEVGSVKEFLTFVFDGADAINGLIPNPSLSKRGAEIYNLAGQKMNRLQRGINIVNGKKIFVK
ncbi:MAG: InlB B-repeat-containing protein [Bacteroidaceae bacterium]|nr:InlB B-repeat-containing protein [Bacteroidaceae bacterium]